MPIIFNDPNYQKNLDIGDFQLAPAWDWCPSCNGHGVVGVWIGDYSVEDCETCRGGGIVRKRDAKGRFTSASTTTS